MMSEKGHAFQATVNTHQSVSIQQTYNLQNHMFDEVDKIISFVKDDQGHDPRWLAIFTTHLEEGFMALRKCIAQPNGRVKKEQTDPQDAA